MKRKILITLIILPLLLISFQAKASILDDFWKSKFSSFQNTISQTWAQLSAQAITATIQTTTTTDLTPRISYWTGLVNQHVDVAKMAWSTDPDGVSGTNIDKLTYCKKWYPGTLSVEDYKTETINTWYDKYNKKSYTSTRMSTKCVQHNGPEPAFPDGCTSSSGDEYSTTTGLACDGSGKTKPPVYPNGCTSNSSSEYSDITGYACDGSGKTKPPVYPDGCTSSSGDEYSTTTGYACDGSENTEQIIPDQNFPDGCTSNNRNEYSTTTGYACDGSGNTEEITPYISNFPDGCTSYTGNSSTTGLPCDGSTPSQTLNQEQQQIVANSSPLFVGYYRALRLGIKGEDVKEFQKALIQGGYLVGVADGSFGPRTKKAVMAYQIQNDLSMDGVAGAGTIGKLIGKKLKFTGTPLPIVKPKTIVKKIIKDSNTNNTNIANNIINTTNTITSTSAANVLKINDQNTNSQTCDPNNKIPSVTVVSPNGGNVFKPGQQISIVWTSCNIPVDDYIDITLFSYKKGVRGVSFLFDAAINNGQTNITLPDKSVSNNASLEWGNNFKIFINRISKQSPASDFSDNYFSIK